MFKRVLTIEERDGRRALACSDLVFFGIRLPLRKPQIYLISKDERSTSSIWDLVAPAANEGVLGFHVLIFESLEASDVVRFSGGCDQQCCIILTPSAGAWS